MPVYRPRPLTFPLCARCSPHARSARSLFPAHPFTTHTRSHFRCALTVSHTPVYCPHPLAFPLCTRCFPHARLHFRIPAQFPARPRLLAFPLRACCFPHTRSLFPTCPLAFPHFRSVSPTPTRISAARSLFPACMHSLFPTSASSSTSSFLLHLALPLRLASPAKLSQAPNMIKTGYRTSRVWIWSSKNGRQRGVG
jgi:hypothetical protein